MATTDSALTRLGPAYIRTNWTFQAIVASPIFILLGFSAFLNIFYSYGPIYDFIADLCTAALAGGIIFVVVMQRRLKDAAGRRWTFRLEAIKAALATALWLWFLMDAIFGPSSHYGAHVDGRKRRIASAIVSIVLLALFFYPTAVFTYLAADADSGEEFLERDEESGEREALLRH